MRGCLAVWGSWNDQNFGAGTQPRYEELSEKLYQLLNRAIVMAANSSSYGTLT